MALIKIVGSIVLFPLISILVGLSFAFLPVIFFVALPILNKMQERTRIQRGGYIPQTYSCAHNPMCGHKNEPRLKCCNNQITSTKKYYKPVMVQRFIWFGKNLRQMTHSECCGQSSPVFVNYVETVCTSCNQVLFSEDVGFYVAVCQCCGSRDILGLP